jgi:DNA-binding protein H-NS
MRRKKRRGRPPGSKNKSKFTGSAAKMDVLQLSGYIASLQKTLAAKVEEQRAYFERQLAGLGGYTSTNGRRTAGSTGARVAKPRTGRRAKPQPKYQSKKDPKLKWTGRGMTPIWMRDEMKGTKLKKENFLIK